ncbi:hypothetical protein HDU78_010493 [Chytriomyces hyalinus]|nr:hypothetical protein HDU78_010493 [Chytriomyces hyalinus]
MKHRNDNKKALPTTTMKKQKKESNKKKESLPPDVTTLWAKVSSSQALQLEARPVDYKLGDSDFKESSLLHAGSTKSSNPQESKPPDKSDFCLMGILESLLASLSL